MGAGCASLVAVILVAAAPASSIAAPGPERLAERITQTHVTLLEAVEAWRDEAGDPPAGQAPATVVEPARALQEQVRDLAALAEGRAPHAGAAAGRDLRAEVRDLWLAARKLRELSGGGKPRKLRTGKPEPLASLDGHYREARAALRDRAVTTWRRSTWSRPSSGV